MNLRLVKKYHYIFVIIIFALNVIVLGWIYFGLNFEAKETYKNHLKGDWIAFSCSPAGDANLSSIFLIRPDGSDLQQITPNNAVASMPNWSPDGYWIAFVSNGSLFKIHPDGSDFQSILYDNNNFPDENRNTLPEWSPDGEWIVFSMATSANSIYQLYKIRLDGTEFTKITNSNCNAVAPSWFSFSQ